MSAVNINCDVKTAEATKAEQFRKHLDKALAGKQLLKKVDQLKPDQGKGKKPAKAVCALYQNVFDKELKRLQSKNPEFTLSGTVSYMSTRGAWRASSQVSCKMKRYSVGGGSYRVQPNDTLWLIAEKFYGNGALWTEIASANPTAVKSNGNFILAGVILKVPKLSLPKGDAGLFRLTSASCPKLAAKPAKAVALPTMVIEFDTTKPVTRIFSGPKMAWKVTLKLTGSLEAQRPGEYGGTATLSKNSVEVEKDLKHFTSGIRIEDFSKGSISIGSKVEGSSWQTKLSVNHDGSLTGSAAPKAISFISKGGTKFGGKIGYEINIRPMPRVKMRDLKGRIWEVVEDDGELILGVTMVVAYGAIVAGAAMTPVPGDELVAYSMAVNAMPKALKMIR